MGKSLRFSFNSIFCLVQRLATRDYSLKTMWMKSALIHTCTTPLTVLQMVSQQAGFGGGGGGRSLNLTRGTFTLCSRLTPEAAGHAHTEDIQYHAISDAHMGNMASRCAQWDHLT